MEAEFALQLDNNYLVRASLFHLSLFMKMSVPELWMSKYLKTNVVVHTFGFWAM